MAEGRVGREIVILPKEGAVDDGTKLGCLGKGMGLRKYLESENTGREMKILETRRRDTVGEASLLK